MKYDRQLTVGMQAFDYIFGQFAVYTGVTAVLLPFDWQPSL